jgi:hypothetical protein
MDAKELLMENLRVILLTAIFATLVSCGDLFTKDLKNKAISLSQFATCKLDMDAFAKILEQNIEGDINCLREKLKMFISTVESDRPGYASKEVLKNYLLTGPIDVDPGVVDIVDSVFDLSHIIIGTEKDYIINSDMDVLLDFLIFLNTNMRETYKVFTEDKDLNYKLLIKERGIVYKEISLIANKLNSIYKRNRPGVDSIDTKKFIYNFFKNEPNTMDKINSLMFIKRVFLGGDKWKLDHHEFGDILRILPDLAQVAFDVTKSKHYTFDDQQEKTADIFRNDFQILSNVTYFDRNSEEAIFTIHDVVSALETFDPELLPIDLTKYPKELKKVKEIFLGVNDEIVFGHELFKLYDHAINLLSEGILGYRVYEMYKDDLNSTDLITHHFRDFPVNTSNDEIYLERFVDVVHNYKFFKGGNQMPFFTFGVYRNPNAFFEITTIEFVVREVMKHYGFKADGKDGRPLARGGYHMVLNTEDIEPGQPDRSVYGLIKDFKWLLKDEGLAIVGRKNGGELQRVANNVVLLSTLFQNQSDGCDSKTVCMEVPEVTEFAIGLFTAMEIKGFFNEQMKTVCSAGAGEFDTLDNFGRINPECFRRNFINVLRIKNPEDNNLSIADYMPQLNKYFDELTAEVPAGQPITSSSDYMKFMGETEGFTRVCTNYEDGDKEEVWLTEDDAFAVFAGLLNVESTMLRWDLDQNGRMDFDNAQGDNEVLNAYYTTYEGAIKGLVDPNGGFLTKLAKPVFQFIIKYGRVPNTKNVKDLWKLAKILVSKRARRADARRVTISTVLKVVGEENGKSDEVNHDYKCRECIDPGSNCTHEDNPTDPDEWSL